MSKRYQVMGIIIGLTVLWGSAFAQLKTQGVALGIGGGGVLGDTDFGRDEKAGFQASAWLRHSIVGPLEGQITGSGFGEIQRDGANRYRTRLYSGDYRLLLRLFSNAPFSPYAYGGFGGLYYEVKEPPPTPSPAAETDTWKTFAPLGGGFQLRLASRWSIDVSGGYNVAFTDDLNLVRGGDDDGYFNATIGLTFTPQGGPVDSDGDGLTDKEEEYYRTNKYLPDSDGDGLNDGEELRRYRTHPMKVDTDNDGLNDQVEVLSYQTDPRRPDSDGDGLSDSEEVFTHRTSPVMKDSDSDGVSDKDEISISKTDPNDPDTDKDGLNDGQELVTHRTNPREADTDKDGLSDKEEIEVSRTNPLKTDTDLDGLTDGEEMLTYNTDPLDDDTDGGGAEDGDEVSRGSDPLNPDDDMVLDVGEGEKVVLDGIIFALNSARISPQSALILEKAYNTLLDNPEMMVEIHGFTDNTGPYSYNMQLSQRRAESVREFLIRKGIDPGRIVARGFGPADPIASNATAAGRARNRRIEFVRIR